MPQPQTLHALAQQDVLPTQKTEISNGNVHEWIMTAKPSTVSDVSFAAPVCCKGYIICAVPLSCGKAYIGLTVCCISEQKVNNNIDKGARLVTHLDCCSSSGPRFMWDADSEQKEEWTHAACLEGYHIQKEKAHSIRDARKLCSPPYPCTSSLEICHCVCKSSCYECACKVLWHLYALLQGTSKAPVLISLWFVLVWFHLKYCVAKRYSMFFFVFFWQVDRSFISWQSAKRSGLQW